MFSKKWQSRFFNRSGVKYGAFLIAAILFLGAVSLIWQLIARSNIDIFNLKNKLSDVDSTNVSLQNTIYSKDREINKLEAELMSAKEESSELENEIEELEEENYWLECELDGILTFCNTLRAIENDCKKRHTLSNFQDYTACRERKLREAGYGYVLDYEQ